MPAADLSKYVRISLAICALFLSTGASWGWIGSWSLQAFFVQPPCPTADNSTPCCPTCLGVSSLEYGFYIALPSVVGMVGVIFSGLVIDVFGFPTATIIFVTFDSLGNIIRAIGSLLVFHHGILVACLIFGQTILVPTSYAILVSREYILIRYFEEHQQPLLMGFTYAFNNLFTAVACFVAPWIAETFGVPAAMWTIAVMSMTGLVVGVVLVFIFRFSTTLQYFERELCDEKQQRRSCREVIRCVRDFKPQYWFCSFAFTLSYGAQIAFDTNAPVLQTRLSNITAFQAGLNMGWGYLGYALVCLLTGFLIWLTGPQASIAFISTLVIITSLSLVFISIEIAMASIGLFGSVYTILKLHYGRFVPPESLGLASSLTWTKTLIMVGVLSCITGPILQEYKGATGALIALAVIIGVYGIAALLLLILWCRYGSSTKEDRKLGDGKSLLDKNSVTSSKNFDAVKPADWKE